MLVLLKSPLLTFLMAVVTSLFTTFGSSTAYAHVGEDTMPAESAEDDGEAIHEGAPVEFVSHWIGGRVDLGRGARTLGISYRGGSSQGFNTLRGIRIPNVRRVGTDITLRRSGQNWGWGLDGNVLLGHSGFSVEAGGGVAVFGGEFRAVLTGAMFFSFFELFEFGYRHQRPILSGPRPDWLPSHYLALRFNMPFMGYRVGESPSWIFDAF